MKGEKFVKTLLLLGCPQRPTTAYNIDTKRLRIRPYITRSNGKKEGKKRGKSTISQILRDFRNLTCVIGFSRSETQRHKHKQGFQYWSDDVGSHNLRPAPSPSYVSNAPNERQRLQRFSRLPSATRKPQNMLQHRGNGTRPCSSLPSKQTTQGKGGGTATNRQTLRIDVTQLTTARNAIRCRRQSSSKETSRSFIQSDQRGKSRSSKREATTATHTHTQTTTIHQSKKKPHWHNSARQKKNFTSTATSEARPRPTTRLLPCCHANQKSSHW